MPACPIDRNMSITGPCSEYSCYLNVPTLDFRCLHLHSKIYNKSPVEILTDLYGKPYKMTVALSIKATRIAYAMKELRPQPNRLILHPFEKEWVDSIKKAGALTYTRHWTVLTSKNKKYKFQERMLQVLNTMEVEEYSLKDLLEAYNFIFYKIDFSAFAIPKNKEKEALDFMRGV